MNPIPKITTMFDCKLDENILENLTPEAKDALLHSLEKIKMLKDNHLSHYQYVSLINEVNALINHRTEISKMTLSGIQIHLQSLAFGKVILDKPTTELLLKNIILLSQTYIKDQKNWAWIGSIESIKIINLTEIICQNYHFQQLGEALIPEESFDPNDFYSFNFSPKTELTTDLDVDLKLLKFNNYEVWIENIYRQKLNAVRLNDQKKQKSMIYVIEVLERKMIEVLQAINYFFDSTLYPDLFDNETFRSALDKYLYALFFLGYFRQQMGSIPINITIFEKNSLKNIFTNNATLKYYINDMKQILMPPFQKVNSQLNKRQLNKKLNALIAAVKNEMEKDKLQKADHGDKINAILKRSRRFMTINETEEHNGEIKLDLYDIVDENFKNVFFTEITINLFSSFFDTVEELFKNPFRTSVENNIDLFKSLPELIKKLAAHKIDMKEKKYVSTLVNYTAGKMLRLINKLDKTFKLNHQDLIVKIHYEIISCHYSIKKIKQPEVIKSELINTAPGMTLIYFNEDKSIQEIRYVYSQLIKFMMFIVYNTMGEDLNSDKLNSLEAIGKYVAHLISLYSISKNEEDSDRRYLNDVTTDINNAIYLLLHGKFKLFDNKVEYTLMDGTQNKDPNISNSIYIDNHLSLLMCIISINPNLHSELIKALSFSTSILSNQNLNGLMVKFQKELTFTFETTFFIKKINPFLYKHGLAVLYGTEEKNFFIRSNNSESQALTKLFTFIKTQAGYKKLIAGITFDEMNQQIIFISEKQTKSFILGCCNGKAFSTFQNKKTQKKYQPTEAISASVSKAVSNVDSKTDLELDYGAEIKNKLKRITFGHDYVVEYKQKERIYVISLQFKAENAVHKLSLTKGTLILTSQQLQEMILTPLAKKLTVGKDIYEFTIHENQIKSPIFKNEFFTTLKSIKTNLKKCLAEQHESKISEKTIETSEQPSLTTGLPVINSADLLKKMRLALFTLIKDKTFNIAMNWMKLSNQPISDKVSFFIQQSDVKCHSQNVKILDLLSYLSIIIKPKNTLILKENTLIVSLAWLNNFDKDNLIYQTIYQKIQGWVEKNKISKAMPELKTPEKKPAAAKSKAHVYTHAESGTDHPYMTNLQETQEFKRHCKLFIDLELKSANKDSIYLQAAFMLFHHALRYLSNNAGAQNKQAITTLAENILTGKFHVNHENANKLFAFLSVINKLYGNKSIAQSSVAIKISEALTKLDLEMMPTRPATIADLNFYITIFAKLPYIIHQEKPVNSVLHANLYLLLQIGRVVLELSESEKNILFKLAAFKLFFDSAIGLFKIVKAKPEKMLSTLHQQINDILTSFSIGTPEDNREKLIDLMNEFECIKEQNQSAQIWGPG